MILFKLFLLIIIIYIIKYINTLEKYVVIQNTHTERNSSKIDLVFYKLYVLGNKITLYSKKNGKKTTYELGDRENTTYISTENSNNKIQFTTSPPHPQLRSDKNLLTFHVKDYNMKFMVDEDIYIIIPEKFKTCDNISYMSNDSSKSYELSECEVNPNAGESDKNNILLLNNLDNFEKNMLIPQ